MCNGFGTICWQDGSVEFIEPDKSGDVHHSEILRRSSKTGTDTMDFMRNFVRTEFPD